VISLTLIQGGEAQNQIAGRVVLKGTARFLTEAGGETLRDALRRIAEGIAATFAVQVDFGWRAGVPLTGNDPVSRNLAAEAAARVAPVRRDLRPAMTGEDFAWFLREVPGAFVWIGNGDAGGGSELHSPHYDFNDAILPVASRTLAEMAKASLAA
jgi:hippurate hydrolase